jgi:rhomboid protease GluP
MLGSMSPEVSLETANDGTPVTLVEVGVYKSYAVGAEHGLVVLAMGLPYWLMPAGEKFALFVDAPAADAVRTQLSRFDRESIGWPPQPIHLGTERRSTDLLTPLLWAALVLATFRAQQFWPAFTRDAALDATAIFAHGEWWRLGTALFVHADIGHLVSNVLSGIFVFAAVTSTIGRSRGWTLLGLAALIGNLASAWLRYPASYVSVGASTAIFAGVGLLTGRAIRIAARVDAPRRWQSMFVPFAAGLTVFALYGAGEVRVDVGAHLCGFVAGTVFGVWAMGGARRGMR